MAFSSDINLFLTTTRIETSSQCKTWVATGFIAELYEHAGSETTLIDDNTRKLEKAIKGFNETYGILSQNGIFNDVGDSLNTILKSRGDFAESYSNLLNTIKKTLSGKISNLGELTAVYDLINEKLDNFTTEQQNTLNFKEYNVEFDSLMWEKDTLNAETKEIKEFTNMYVPSLKKIREKIVKTGMGEELIGIQNTNFKSLDNYLESKLETLQFAYDKVGIPHRNLVKKLINEMENTREEIADITGTKYERTTATPKLKHPTPVSLKNNKPVREGLSFGGMEAGLLYNPENSTLNPSVPLLGIRENFGGLTLALGAGYSKTSGSNKTEEFVPGDPITGMQGHHIYKFTDWGHVWAGYADLSVPIVKEVNFNLGVLGISKDSNPRGTVIENMILPNGDEVIGQPYTLNLPATSSTEFYGTAGLKQNTKNFDAKAKVAFAKGKKPSYMATVGYNF